MTRLDSDDGSTNAFPRASHHDYEPASNTDIQGSVPALHMHCIVLLPTMSCDRKCSKSRMHVTLSLEKQGINVPAFACFFVHLFVDLFHDVEADWDGSRGCPVFSGGFRHVKKLSPKS